MRSALLALRRAVFRTLPRSVQRRLLDWLEDFRRRHPSPHKGLEQFGLPGTQVYPQGNNFDRCLAAGIVSRLQGLSFGRDTPVASIGSCFANEFASHLREAGFNYVASEADMFPASANWGRVYTIPSRSRSMRPACRAR
ncbi:MAG TPA: hypothetical protein VI391_06340, partial [Thermoanaerobaculia bacterium]